MALRDSRTGNRGTEDKFRALDLADLGAQVDYVAAALAQQRLRDEEQPEN